MADKVIEALINPTVLNQIVPILSEKIAESVAESINKALEKKINDHITTEFRRRVCFVSCLRVAARSCGLSGLGRFLEFGVSFVFTNDSIVIVMITFIRYNCNNNLHQVQLRQR
jgi:hypothetical protein